MIDELIFHDGVTVPTNRPPHSPLWPEGQIIFSLENNASYKRALRKLQSDGSGSQ